MLNNNGNGKHLSPVPEFNGNVSEILPLLIMLYVFGRFASLDKEDLYFAQSFKS